MSYFITRVYRGNPELYIHFCKICTHINLGHDHVVDLDLSADPRYAEALGTSANQAVPEFGSIAALVLVIAITSIIVVSRSKIQRLF